MSHLTQYQAGRGCGTQIEDEDDSKLDQISSILPPIMGLKKNELRCEVRRRNKSAINTNFLTISSRGDEQ